MTHQDFWRITLDTNPDHCNINCLMCEDHSPYLPDRGTGIRAPRRPKMKVSLLEKTIRDAARLGIREVIPSTMGEPLTYPHFERFIELCAELGLKLNLTTNGTFPKGRTASTVEDWAHRIVPIASDVKISWNGARAGTQAHIMRGTTLETHLENARRFIHVRDGYTGQERCSVTMQLTFMQDNLSEIPDMVRLAIRLGFDRIKGHHLWVHFKQMEGQDLRGAPQLAERWNRVVEECVSVVAEANGSGDRTFALDNFHRMDPANARNATGPCPFLGREIWIDPTGRFNACCAPDQLRRRLGEFGNVNETPLADIVASPAYRKLQRTYRGHALCRTCTMRRLDV